MAGSIKERVVRALRHSFPITRWLPAYDWRADLSGDIVAALTVTAVAAPEAVSYAAIAGLPAAQGLYTGLLAPIAYALTGSSPQLIVGPTAIMCILTHNAIPTTWGGAAVPDFTKSPAERVALAGLLALCVAFIQAAIALLRLGSLVGLISLPVVAGFTTGSALLTASSQFATLLGLSKCAWPGSNVGCTFGQAVVDIFQRGSSIKWPVVGMSIACIALLLAIKMLPRILPKRLALVGNLAPLGLVLVSVPIAWVFEKTLDDAGLPPPQSIPSGLPPFALPFGADSPLSKGSSNDVFSLLTAALPLAIVGYMGAVTISKTVARQHGPYAVDAAQEAWGQVATNAACGLGSGLPVTGSFSRTAVNASSGARTALASALTGLLMGASLLTLTTPLAHIPTIARSAIVIVAITKMVELNLFVRFWRVDRADALVFALTLGVVLFLDSATGLLMGVLAQWAIALTRAERMPTPVIALSWSRARGGAGASTSGSASAADRAVSAGWVWVDSTSTAAAAAAASAAASAAAVDEDVKGIDERRVQLLGKGSSVNDSSTHSLLGALDSTTMTPPAVIISFGPDLQFSSADRLSTRLSEALFLLSPALLALDLSGATSPAGGFSNGGGSSGGGSGIALDVTGAAALLAAADDAVNAGVPLCAFGLSGDALSHIIRTAPPTSHTSPAATRAHAVATRHGGVLAGSLLLLPHWAAVEAVAREVCAAAALGEFDDIDVVNEDGDDTEAGKRLPGVRGVEPSPLEVTRASVRRSKGVPARTVPQPADLHASIAAAAKDAPLLSSGMWSSVVEEARASVAALRALLAGHDALLSAPPRGGGAQTPVAAEYSIRGLGMK